MAASPAKIWTALLAVYIVWGSTYLAIRYAIGAGTGDVGLPPLLMGAVRFGIAGLLMLAFAVRRPHPDGQPDPLGWRQWRATALVGVPLILGGNGLVMLAEERITSGVAAVLITTTPLWLTLMAFLLGGERISRAGLGGLLLGFAGVALLADPRDDSIDTLGAVMVLLAAFCWSCGSYYSRHAPVPRRPFVMTAMEMLCGGVAMGLVSVVSGDAAELRLGEVDLRAWIAAGYLLVAGSMVAFTAYVWLLRNANLALVGTYAFVNPIVAVGLGALPPLREPLGTRTVVASAVIVVGVALIVTTRRPAAPAGPRATAGAPADAPVTTSPSASTSRTLSGSGTLSRSGRPEVRE